MDHPPPLVLVPRRLLEARRSRLARAFPMLGLLLLSWSCSDKQLISPQHGDTSKWLTPEAAARLDGNGHFVTASAGVGELTEPEARRLAAAYLRLGSRWLAGIWQRDRGQSIEFDKLSLCSRAYYAHPLFDPGPSASQALREYLGPQWLFTACTPSGVQVVSIAVSALANELHATNGRIEGPGGGQFFSVGIPTSVSSAPISPEDAAQLAAEVTGQPISEVPELVLPPAPYAAQMAKWRLRLANPVTMTGQTTGKPVTTRELYVGPVDTWRATDIQIGHGDAVIRQARDQARDASLSLVPFSGYSTNFERARVIGQ